MIIYQFIANIYRYEKIWLLWYNPKQINWTTHIFYDILIQKIFTLLSHFQSKNEVLETWILDPCVYAYIFSLSLILDLIFVLLNRHMLIIFLSNHLQGLIALRKIHVFTKANTNLTRIKESLNSWIICWAKLCPGFFINNFYHLQKMTFSS